MTDETDLPHARAVDASAFIERTSPWPSATEFAFDLAMIVVGGVVWWIVVERLEAPVWVAFAVSAAVLAAGTVGARIVRRVRTRQRR